jgi:hypothetical protein
MIFWSNGIKAFSDTKNIRLATVQNGGLIIYTQDSIKMSIKLYSFIEQKDNWQDEYRCADNSYKYVLDRGFF